MSIEHPITPPPELVGEWLCSEDYLSDASTFSSMTITSSRLQNIATQAARWGWQQRDASVPEELQKARDTELDACCEWLSVPCPSYGRELRNARRSKPPSLAEQGLEALEQIDG